MNWILFLSIIGAVLSLGGNILIMLKKRSGWIAWIAGNFVWIGVNIIGPMNIPMVLMYLAYLIINIGGFINWKE